VVPSYRHERYIEAALDSVLAQDERDIELIVIDDASPDGTAARAAAWLERPEVVERFARIVLEVAPANRGAHASINAGLRQATGDWLTILNSDDRYAPGRLRRLLDAASSQGRHWAFSTVACIDADDRPVRSGAAWAFESAADRALAVTPTTGFGFVGSQISISTGNLLFSRDLWTAVGAFSALRYCHDWDFALRALCYDEPAYVAEALYDYRLHPGNSYLALAEVAHRESLELFARYRDTLESGRARNPLAPCPRHWPGVFETYARCLGTWPHWQAAAASDVSI